MITWQTRKAWGHTAEDLALPDLVYQVEAGRDLFNFLTLDPEDFAPSLAFDLTDRSPVVRMWRGYEFALGIYLMQMSFTGHHSHHIFDTVFWDISRAIEEMKHYDEEFRFSHTPWHADTLVMLSHRSNLIRRDEAYIDLWPSTPQEMPYIWPFVESDGTYRLMISKAEQALLDCGDRSLADKYRERIHNL